MMPFATWARDHVEREFAFFISEYSPTNMHQSDAIKMFLFCIQLVMLLFNNNIASKI